MSKRGKYEIKYNLEELVSRLPMHGYVGKIGRRLGKEVKWEAGYLWGNPNKYTGSTPEVKYD